MNPTKRGTVMTVAAEQGLIGGDLFGEHTMKVLDPERLVADWTDKARAYGWTYTRISIPGASVFTLYTQGCAFLWIWKEEKDNGDQQA